MCVVLAAGVHISNPDDVVEVRGPKDYFCYGHVECDVEQDATILTFKPKGLYVPASKYCVRLRSVALLPCFAALVWYHFIVRFHNRAAAIAAPDGLEQKYTDVVWTFETAPTTPLRLLATQVRNAHDQKLVTVPRHSSSMFSELRTVLAARFNCPLG